MNRANPRRRHLCFLLTAVFLFGADLWSKNAAFNALGDSGEYDFWHGVLKFQTTVNPGMMWGMAREVPAIWWVAIRGTVLIGLIALYFSVHGVSPLVPVAFGMVTAGALGNIWDNIFQGLSEQRGLFEGAVRDFIRFYWFEFPTFNVADSCICVGAPLLLITLWRHDRAIVRSQRAIGVDLRRE